MFIGILDHVLDRLRGLYRLAYGVGRQWAIAVWVRLVHPAA